MKTRLVLLITLISLVVLAWLIHWRWEHLGWAGQDVPVPDLEHSHPLVRDAILKAAEDLRNDPYMKDGWGNYGTLLFANYHRDEALVCLAQAAQIDPNEIRWHYYQAFILEIFDLERAAIEYRHAVRCDPHYYPARLRLSRVLIQLGQEEEAAQVLEDGLRLHPDVPFLLLERGRLALGRGELEQSRSLLQRAIAIRSWNPRPAMIELSRVHRLQGDLETALELQNAALQLPEMDQFMEFPDALLAAAGSREALASEVAHEADTLMARGAWDRAITALTELSRLRPEFPRPLFNIAHCLTMKGDLQGAVDMYQEICERFPRDPTAYYSMALLFEELGQVEAALEAYQSAIALKSDYASALFNQGVILERQGRLEEARHAFQQAVDADPRHAQAHLALGTLLHVLGRPRREYLPHIQDAVTLAPWDPIPRQILEEAATIWEDDHPEQELHPETDPLLSEPSTPQ